MSMATVSLTTKSSPRPSSTKPNHGQRSACCSLKHSYATHYAQTHTHLFSTYKHDNDNGVAFWTAEVIVKCSIKVWKCHFDPLYSCSVAAVSPQARVGITGLLLPQSSGIGALPIITCVQTNSCNRAQTPCLATALNNSTAALTLG